MGTVAAVIILLLLLISASITLVVVLTTIPVEDKEAFKTVKQLKIPKISTVKPEMNNGIKSAMKFTTKEKNSDGGTNRSMMIMKHKTVEGGVEADLPFRVTDLEALANGVFVEDAALKAKQPDLAEASTMHPFSTNETILRYLTNGGAEKSAKNVTKTLKRNETTVPEQQLDLLYRVPFSKATRIVGLAYRQQHLYIGTIESRIHVLKAENGEQVQEITLGESAEGMTISSNGNIVIIHGTRIRSFNNGRNVYELELNVPASFITAVGNKVMVLSKNGAQVYVLTDKLEIIRRINVQTDGQNACNFITASDRSVFVSCDKAILQLSKDGRMIRWIGAAENSTYSLGIELDDKQRLLAIKQGQPRIRVFMDGKPIEELYSGRTPSIWSGILYRAGRLHVLDYVANSLLTFQYPTNLL